MSNGNPEYDVFISYKSEYKPWVDTLMRNLERQRLRVWVDDWRKIPGALVAATLDKAISGSRVGVLIVTPEAVAAALPPAFRTTRSVCGTCPAARSCAASKAILVPFGPSPLRRTAAASPPAPRTKRSVCGTWPVARSCDASKDKLALYVPSPLRRTGAASPPALMTTRFVCGT